MKNPCYPECNKRCINCHANCENYLAFQAERAEARKQRMLEGIVNGYAKDQCDKAIKSHSKMLSKGA